MIVLNERGCWFAGLCAADGHVENDPTRGRHVGFYISARDADILTKMALWYGGTVRFYAYSRTDSTGHKYQYEVAKWIGWDPKIRSFLLTNDLPGHLPRESRTLQRHYIRGFLEGDGHVGM